MNLSAYWRLRITLTSGTKRTHSILIVFCETAWRNLSTPTRHRRRRLLFRVSENGMTYITHFIQSLGGGGGAAGLVKPERPNDYNDHPELLPSNRSLLLSCGADRVDLTSLTTNTTNPMEVTLW